MKKLVTLLLVLTGMVCTASATEYTVYFKPSTNWQIDNAKFALYMWDSSSETGKTVDFTSSNGIYSATYDSNYSTGIIILRVDPNTSYSAGEGYGSSSSYGWKDEGKGYWNQTADLPVPAHDIFFDMSNAKDWDTTIRYYVVAASFTDVIDGSSTWSSSTVANAMTPASDYSSSNLVEVTYTNKLLTAGRTYAYKIAVENDNWYPSSNVEFTVATDGYYTIKYTYNTSTNAVSDPTVTLTQAVDYVYGIQQYVNSDYTSLGTMTVNDGVATLTVSPISLTAESNNLQYKISRDVYVDGVNQNASTWSYISNGVDGRYVFTPSLSGDHTVTFYYYPTSDTNWTIAHKIGDAYYLVTDENSWAVSQDNPLTASDGTYSITLSNKANHSFVLFPDYAYSNASTVNWDYSVRPHADNSVSIGFANNSGLIQVGGSVNWDIASTYSDYVTVSFTPSTNTWSVAPYIVKDFTGAPSQDGSYLTTFSNTSYAVAIPDGVTAYYADKTTSGSGIVKMVAFENGIAANTGAFLKASEEKEYHFTPATTPDDVSANNLFVAGNGTLSYDANYFRYVFATQDDDLGFYKIGSTFSTDMTGKAYLESSTTLASTGARVAFVFDDETTAISEGLRVKSEEFSNAPVYNLAGQRVAQPTKGLYIVNGKKVIMK